MIVPVILAGGSGTRLWPLSRELYPKQLLPLVNERSMLQNTVARLADISALSAPLVVCTEHHRFMVAEQLREMKVDATILIEPVGRDTAPAVAVAALEAIDQGADPVLLVLPADHVIGNQEAFRKAVEAGVEQASTGTMITFGIVPCRSETGYGYIKKGERLNTAKDDEIAVYAVSRFVEKPDFETAQQYVAVGGLWNSGMFMFRASKYLEELEKFAPEMASGVRKAHQERKVDLDFIRLGREAFTECPSKSIDYAVMEKTSGVAVIPLDCDWSDVGSWAALWEIDKQDGDGNVLHGNVMVKDSHNCYVNAADRLVAVVGDDTKPRPTLPRYRKPMATRGIVAVSERGRLRNL